MQLYRNNITAVSFASALEKVAKVTPQDILREQQAQGAFDNLQASVDPYSSAKAFAKGLGVSFAIPLALGLSTVDPKTLIKQVQANTNDQISQFYIKQGLLEGGQSTLNADDLAKMIVRSNKNISAPDNFVIPDLEIKQSIKKTIQSELSGDAPPVFIKKNKWSVQVTGQTPSIESLLKNAVKGVSIEDSQTVINNIANNFFTGGGPPSESVKSTAKDLFDLYVKAPTVENIIEKEYKNVGASGSLLNSKQYKNLYTVGEQRAQRLGLLAPTQQTLEKNFLKSFIMRRAKAPLAIGVLGGISAVMQNRKKQDRYKSLLQEVRKRNA